MLDSKQFAVALQQNLPSEYHSDLDRFALLFEKLAEGQLSVQRLKEYIENDSDLVAVSAALSGKNIATQDAVVSFGQGGQIGDVRINDVAGRDILRFEVNIYHSESYLKRNPSQQDNFDDHSSLDIGIISDNNCLGHGICIGGYYRNISMRVIASRWGGYGISWTRSGWLFVPQLGYSLAIAFYKLHILESGSAYIHINDVSHPKHTIWLTTHTGQRIEEDFHHINNPSAVWTFEWK